MLQVINISRLLLFLTQCLTLKWQLIVNVNEVLETNGQVCWVCKVKILIMEQ